MAKTVAEITADIQELEAGLLAELERVRGQAYVAQELGTQLQAASRTLVQSLQLPTDGSEPFHEIVQRVLHKFGVQGVEAEKQQMLAFQEANSLKGQVRELEGQIDNAIRRLVDVLELPGNRNRSLEDCIKEAADVVQGAKQMIRSNL